MGVQNGLTIGTIDGRIDKYRGKKLIFLIPLGRPRCRWEDNIKMDLKGNGKGLWRLDGIGSG